MAKLATAAAPGRAGGGWIARNSNYPKIAASVRSLAPSPQIFRLEDRDAFSALYTQQLDSVGYENVLRELEQISQEHDGRGLVLLCFEDIRLPGKWCHRRLFAEWWERQTAEPVPELGES